jgi:hypothetical protein
MNIAEMFYKFLGGFLDLFYYTYYPASIFLLAYTSYVLFKKNRFNTILLRGLASLSVLPTLVAFVFTIFELFFIKGRYDSIYLLIYAGVGYVINIISVVLLFFYKRRLRDG